MKPKTHSELLENLNPMQREAVLHAGSPLLIFATAGSGKTRVITHRIASLILDKKVAPENILAMTFTNKAADEMKHRVGLLLKLDASALKNLWISTFHKICLRILSAHITKLGYDRAYTIFNEHDQLNLIKDILAALDLSAEKYSPSFLLTRISRAKANMIEPEDYLKSFEKPDYFEETAKKIYMVYQERLRKFSCLDFDDIILLANKLFRKFPDVLEAYRRRFIHVLVDEYQDINHAQYEFVRNVAGNGKNLVAVGDDDQCLTAGTEVMTSRGYLGVESITRQDEVLAAIGWGHTSYFPVGGVSSRHYLGKVVSILLENGRRLALTPNHMVFTKYNIHNDLYYIYLMYRSNFGFRIGLSRGLYILSGSRKGENEVGDKIWFIKVASSIREATFYEYFYSLRYGLPTLQFSQKMDSKTLTAQMIHDLYNEIDTHSRAATLMDDLMLFEEHPHFISTGKGTASQAHKFLSLIMFGNKKRASLDKWFGHKITVESLNPSTGAMFYREDLEIPPEASAPPPAATVDRLNIEATMEDFSQIEHFVQTMASIDNIEIIKRIQLSSRAPFYFQPASHIRVNMILPVFEEEEMREVLVKNVEFTDYNGQVYDLSVENLHNYVANTTLVHNSIYSWRGASSRALVNFQTDFKHTRTITLGQNYRSSASIINAASELVSQNNYRTRKEIFTQNEKGKNVMLFNAANEQDEAYFIVKVIRDLIFTEKKHYSDFAVFYRTNAQSRILEDIFIKEGIPYRLIGATRFYERKEIRDLLAYLRLVVNPDDDMAFRRIINVPKRGIGDKTIDLLSQYAVGHGVSLYGATQHIMDMEELPLKSKKLLLNFKDLLDRFQEEYSSGKYSITSITEFILNDIDYMKEFKNIDTLKLQDKTENLKEFQSITLRFDEEAAVGAGGSRSRGDGGRAEIPRTGERGAAIGSSSDLSGFLEQLSLVTDTDNLETNNEVCLLTLHSSKGLEFPIVFIVGLEEGLFPHQHHLEDDFDIEEERRLLYVGMTRAMERLYMVNARVRRIFGSVLTNSPSRFLNDIPPEFMEIRNSTYDVENSGGIYAHAKLRRTAIPELTRRKGASASQAGGAGGGGGGQEVDVVKLAQSIERGDRVRHAMWGEGQVLDIKGRDVNAIVTVDFMNVGSKELMLKFAPLEKIQE